MCFYDRFCFLVGRFSIYLLAFTCTKRECSLCIQLLKPKVVPYESTIPTYMRYFHVVPSKFACANSNFQNEFPFCVPVPLMRQLGWLIFLWHPGSEKPERPVFQPRDRGKVSWNTTLLSKEEISSYYKGYKSLMLQKITSARRHYACDSTLALC